MSDDPPGPEGDEPTPAGGEPAADRESSPDNRAAALDDLEADLRERRESLESRAEELDRRKDTVREYVGTELADSESSLSSTVQSAVGGLDRAGSRLGTVGDVALALVGFLLVAAAVANAIAALTPGPVRLSSSTTLKFAASGVLLVLGLATNLAGFTGRG
jgi:hypothetical protein